MKPNIIVLPGAVDQSQDTSLQLHLPITAWANDITYSSEWTIDRPPAFKWPDLIKSIKTFVLWHTPAHAQPPHWIHPSDESECASETSEHVVFFTAWNCMHFFSWEAVYKCSVVSSSMLLLYSTPFTVCLWGHVSTLESLSISVFSLWWRDKLNSFCLIHSHNTFNFPSMSVTFTPVIYTKTRFENNDNNF